MYVTGLGEHKLSCTIDTKTCDLPNADEQEIFVCRTPQPYLDVPAGFELVYRLHLHAINVDVVKATTTFLSYLVPPVDARPKPE